MILSRANRPIPHLTQFVRRIFTSHAGTKLSMKILPPVGAAFPESQSERMIAGFVDASGEAQPPRTWEELEHMAVKLTEHDARGRITRLGFAPNFGNAWLY